MEQAADHFAAGVEAGDGLPAGGDDARLLVDLQATEGEGDTRGHRVRLERTAVERVGPVGFGHGEAARAAPSPAGDPPRRESRAPPCAWPGCPVPAPIHSPFNQFHFSQVVLCWPKQVVKKPNKAIVIRSLDFIFIILDLGFCLNFFDKHT